MDDLLEKKLLEARELIEKNSPFDEKETKRILDICFSHILTLVKIVVKEHQFDKKKVLDIGCSYGNSLLFFGKDSEGIEIQEHMVNLIRSLGRTVYKINIEDGMEELGHDNYDAIYCSAVIEHLLSPYLFLVRLHPLLKKGGILALSYPVVPPFFFKSLWKMVNFQGWLQAQHINFFTPETSRLMIERAGFKVIKQYSPVFYRIPFLRSVNSVFLPIGMSCLSICRKIDNFKLGKNRPSLFDPEWASKDLNMLR
jgi:2-polyprenyl-3-methyl-5-hydroxy-6-metoxy-1,4-benzoquinol methylase